VRKFIDVIAEAMDTSYEGAFHAHPHASQYFDSVDDLVKEMGSLDPTADHRYTDWLCRAFLADDGRNGICQGGAVEVTPEIVRSCLASFTGNIEQFKTITEFVHHCVAAKNHPTDA
jgi:hypothetical protein